MKALGNVVEEALHLRRCDKGAGRFERFFARGRFRLVGASASLTGAALRALVFRTSKRETLGEAGAPFVQFGVARADEVKIPALECGEFRAQIRSAQLA